MENVYIYIRFAWFCFQFNALSGSSDCDYTLKHSWIYMKVLLEAILVSIPLLKEYWQHVIGGPHLIKTFYY
jgi:hypothetical protein